MTLDLSKNMIVKLKGLENIDSLRFLTLSQNRIYKILQLRNIENLSLLTELEMCFNPIMDKKHYRLQTLFHIPQLRQLDGMLISAEEKVKAENLHGVDTQDRETIFKAMLPQENFVDRRINVYEDIEVESEDNDDGPFAQSSRNRAQHSSSIANSSQIQGSTSINSVARAYVGELIQSVNYVNGQPEFHNEWDPATFIF